MRSNTSNESQIKAYLPAEIVGGSVPYLPGTEEEAVWNAASQACATEHIHYTYTVEDGRCWYLATPSSALASNPDTWCPLASALPGNPEYWDKETVYLFEQEGVAAALKWDYETGKMQVFSGPARSVLPRVQSMDVMNFVTLNPEQMDQPVYWSNRNLRAEALSRYTVKYLFLAGLWVTLISLLFWVAMHIYALAQRPDLQKAQQETANATMNLMIEAGKMVRSDSSRHLFRVQELLSDLTDVGGTLLKYEVKRNGEVVWQAFIPPALGGNALDQFGAKTIGRSDVDGRLKIEGNG